MTTPTDPSAEMDDPPVWIKNTAETQPIDGDVYILAVRVHDNKRKIEYWQTEQVQCFWYDDGPTLYQGDSAFTDWEWEDVDYFIRCET